MVSVSIGASVRQDLLGSTALMVRLLCHDYNLLCTKCFQLQFSMKILAVVDFNLPRLLQFVKLMIMY